MDMPLMAFCLHLNFRTHRSLNIFLKVLTDDPSMRNILFKVHFCLASKPWETLARKIVFLRPYSSNTLNFIDPLCVQVWLNLAKCRFCLAIWGFYHHFLLIKDLILKSLAPLIEAIDSSFSNYY